MGKAQLEELEKSGKYLSVPRGRSMWPMLRSKKDIVEVHQLLRPAKRYNLVLYVRGENQQGVLHRVLHVRDREYVILGDNCWRREFIPREQVVGIATRFYRNGKWYDVSHKGYLFYVHLWSDFAFIRIPLIWTRDKAKAVLRRLRRKVKKID